MKLSLQPVKAKLVIAENEFTLKSDMRYFSILCREAEGYNRLDPAGTRRPGTSPEGPLKVLKLQGTFRGLLGDQQKIDNLMKKVFSRCSSSCFTHLLLSLTGKRNMQKF